MTLNITVLTEGAVFQCADFRLTDLDSGDVISDASDKIVPLAVDSWSGFATYTGIGRVGTSVRCEDSVKLARRNRRGVMAQTAAIVEAKGTQWLERVLRGRQPLKHTFVLTGFDGMRPTAYVISTSSGGTARSGNPDEI